MTRMYLNKGDNPLIERLAKKAFPEYRGHKIEIEYGTNSFHMASYWEGGSLTSHAIANLATGEVKNLPRVHPAFQNQDMYREQEIPLGFVVIQHVIFCGHDLGIRILTPQPAPLLDNRVELTEDEETVLRVTCSYKSSYGGVKDLRAQYARKAGLTTERIEAARQSLIDKGLLNRRRAVTPKGRTVDANLEEARREAIRAKHAR